MPDNRHAGDRVPPAAGTRVHVVGLGKSGVASALLVARLGCRTTATDTKGREGIPAAAALEAAGVGLDLGSHDPAHFTSADLVVVSPGVPDNEHLRAAGRAGVEIISEVELAWRCSRADFIGITGSNGKSTVTSMTGSMMAASVRPSWAGGNLGTPVCEAVGREADVPGGVFVVELSSFQLERVPTMRCSVAALLNITPDHMDRYPSLEAYADAKGNVFDGQGPGDHAVVPDGEDAALVQARRSRGRLHLVGRAGGEIFAEGSTMRVNGLAGLSADFDAASLGLVDPLYVSNALVAIACSVLAGAGPEAVEAGLGRFERLPHRFVLVAEVGGVKWVDDSKATNPASVVAALKGVTGNAILIAGGLDKHLDFADILPAARGKVRKVLLIGQAARAIEAALGAELDVEHAGDLATAVARAGEIARPGETVLLSPACASFDQFRNFEHRGQVFRQLVEALGR